jgi:uncharacterized protein involved in copper resistance
MKMTLNTIIPGLVALLAMFGAAAQEMDHSQMDHSQMDHSQMDHSQMDHSAHQAAPAYEGSPPGGLAPLEAIPESGNAREAGFDDRYGMEPKSADDDPAARCAQGSRGLVMLDNVEWELCGGKPQGASRGPGYYPAMPPWNEAGTGQSHQMDHSAMGH